MSDEDHRHPLSAEDTSEEDSAIEAGDAATAEEQDALMDEYLERLEAVRAGEIREGVVVAIEDESVLINLGDKSEGVAPLGEFTAPGGRLLANVGDTVAVKIIQREAASGHIRVSYSVARREKALDTLTDALKTGATVNGVAVKAVKAGLLVDCGIDCFMPASHIDIRHTDNLEEWIGKPLEFQVLELHRKRGRAVVSRRKLMESERDRLRGELIAALNVGDTVEGEVKNVVAFGAFVDLGGVEAFIPREEVSWEKAVSPMDCLRPGNTVRAKAIRISPESGKITLSRRQLTEDPWLAACQRYPKGAVVTGEVTGLTKFGAFVRLEEGLTGLVHVTDLSWSSGHQRPEDVLKEGDRVEVAVLEVDSERKRLSLGLKQMSEDPWLEAESRFPVGTRVKGQVTGVTKFGAFVRLDETIEGLVHRTDFSWEKNPPEPSELVKPGDEVEAVVLKTDKTSRRISLGVKQLTPSPMEAFAAKHKTGQTIEGKVVSVIDAGAFLELEPGVEGFLHISQLDRDKVNKVTDVVKPGETIQVKITKVDVRDNRVALSRKALLQAEERKQVATYLRDKDDSAKGGVNLGELLQKINLPSSE